MFILSTALAASPQEQSTSRALNYTSKALYKHLELDKATKRLEDKYLPDSLKKYGWTALVIKVGLEQKISVQWSF